MERQRGFELAREALDSRVEDLDIDVMNLSPERIGAFDLVLFLGVLYHLRHPLLALEWVASVTAAQLILETHVDLTWVRRPAMAFYRGQELDWDPTNWWGPNPSAVEGDALRRGLRPRRAGYAVVVGVPRGAHPAAIGTLREVRLAPPGPAARDDRSGARRLSRVQVGRGSRLTPAT
jgi:hypothetical protein